MHIHAHAGQRNGFVIMELLLVIGILGALSGMALPVYRDYQIKNDLNLAMEQVTQGLGRAKLLSQSGQDDAPWGFYVPSGTLYKGSSYAMRDSTFDEIYPMPSTITTTGLIDVAYSQGRGLPSATGEITLTALSNDRRFIEIAVETESVAKVADDEITICHTPPGNPENAHTQRVSEAAWPAHRDNHGDTLGACDGEEEGEDDDDDEEGEDDDDDDQAQSSSAASSASSSSSAAITCEDRFSVAADGTITTTGTLSATFTALGSAITWGAGGPEIAVTLKRSKTNGNGMTDLFSGADIDGGESEVVTGFTDGKQLTVSFKGYYRQSRWLTFDETYTSGDGSGHVVVLRDGDPLPDYPTFDDQESLESFLQNILDESGHIDIGTYDVVMLVELGSLASSSADFQDAVLLIQFAEPSNCD